MHIDKKTFIAIINPSILAVRVLKIRNSDMTRQMDQQERRERVLGIVVEQYIGTITPVSSNFIVQHYRLDLSPATIRNILAELEERGYLTHPHTSAGRVPTQHGYRYYVDHLMNEIQLLEEEKARIQVEYKQGVAELETLLDKTSEVIANLTHYTSIICVDGMEDKFYCKGTSFVVGYPEAYDIDKIGHILKALEEKKRLWEIINVDLKKNIEILIGEEISYSDIDSCSLAISSFKKENGPSGRIAVLGPTRMNYEKVVSTLEYISELMTELL